VQAAFSMSETSVKRSNPPACSALTQIATGELKSMGDKWSVFTAKVKDRNVGKLLVIHPLKRASAVAYASLQVL